MKKRKILISVIIALLIVLSGLIWWQYNNFKAIYYSMSYSDEDIDNLITKNNRDIKEYMDRSPQISVRPTEEVEEKLHQQGVITDNELVDIITGKDSVQGLFGIDLELSPNKNFVNSDDGKIVDKDSLLSMKEDKKNSSPAQDENNIDSAAGEQSGSATVDNSEAVSQCIANLYVLKSSFIGRLDSLYSEAVSYYKNLPPADRKNAKSEMIKKFYSSGTALEAECDGAVANLISELKTLLEEEGSDTTITEKIQSAYENEKSLKKAQYLNKLS